MFTQHPAQGAVQQMGSGVMNGNMAAPIIGHRQPHLLAGPQRPPADLSLVENQAIPDLDGIEYSGPALGSQDFTFVAHLTTGFGVKWGLIANQANQGSGFGHCQLVTCRTKQGQQGGMVAPGSVADKFRLHPLTLQRSQTGAEFARSPALPGFARLLALPSHGDNKTLLIGA